MERVDLYRNHFEKTKESIERKNPIPKGKYSLIVFVCIFNSEGKMLIQQRQATKKGWPNMWDVAAGGAVRKNETSAEAIKRETFEELGLSFKKKEFVKLMSVYYNHQIHDFYSITADVNIEDLVLQKEEVKNAKWATEEEIIEMIRNRTFVSLYEEVIHLFFRMKTKKGLL